MTQKQALDILKTGANVFLTGEPGSGKTHTINEFVAYLRDCGIEPAITASTGIAATHIGGMTIHSWSGIGIKRSLSKYDLDKIGTTEYLSKRIRRTKVLIIDEVSMLSADTLSMVDAVCREIKDDSAPFGGMQIILVGDFFQLPPIVKIDRDEEMQATLMDEPKALFACDAPVWKRLQPIICYLTEQYRQDDKNFLDVLSAIRRNDFSEEHLEYLTSRKIEKARIPADIPKLFSHNFNVDTVNDETLNKLGGVSQNFFMMEHGPEALVTALKKGCLSPEKLSLKIGATVMFTKNNQKEGFVNGTLGVVEGFGEIGRKPIVRARNGRQILVEPMEWVIEENGKVKARISQLPLRLAWAITVHKSQGLSLDEAIIDLGSVFEFGQGYVALSRVRRLSGLHLLGWNEKAFKVHPVILERDQDFRTDSIDAEQTFGEIPKTGLAKMHENFVTICGGSKIKKKKNQKSPAGASARGEAGDGFAKIRETYPNAYRSWSEQEDEKLKELFNDGNPVDDLAKTFGRKNGAIKARLIKLGLIEEDW